jgi:hypothetical protein
MNVLWYGDRAALERRRLLQPAAELVAGFFLARKSSSWFCSLTAGGRADLPASSAPKIFRRACQ